VLRSTLSPVNRTSQPRELLLELDRTGQPKRQPLRAQIEQQLRAAIREGRLPAATRLPSTRELARELAVSRGMIVEAYRQLAAEGYLDVRQGAAPRVAAAAVETVPPASEPEADRVRFDFRPGLPDLTAFPRDAWLASLRRSLQAAPDAALGYGDPRGTTELRAAIAAYLGRVRGTLAEPERIVVCSGFAQGLGLLCRALCALGARRVAMEDPSHRDQRTIVERAGLEVLPVRVDVRGLLVDELEAADPDAVVVTPAHQFPTGSVLAPERRSALLAWAERREAVIIEDDYDAEYRYDRAPVGALQGLSPDRVAYAGSTSKTLAPALRLAWLVVPSWLLGEVTTEKAFADLGSPRLEQLALADFLERGDLDRHLRRTRLRYRGRRQVLVAALRRLVAGVEVEGIDAGLHAVARLPAEADEAAVLERARARGIALAGVSEHRFEPASAAPSLLLGYGRLPEPTIEAGIEELARVIAACRKPRARGR
jgi:GntR family transcriptional regulator / MocR family aminotransferase